MNDTELAKPPKIGALVRSKVPFARGRQGSSGRVKAILSDEDGAMIVIESVCGGEYTLSAWEYSCFFEPCNFQD